jgi:toxin ParE2
LRVRVLTPARWELQDAIRYYEAQRPQLGEQFRNDARQTIARITKFPDAWQPLSSTTRRCQMSRFPFALVYATTETEILIIAVANLHRAPEYWRSRIDEF